MLVQEIEKELSAQGFAVSKTNLQGVKVFHKCVNHIVYAVSFSSVEDGELKMPEQVIGFAGKIREQLSKRYREEETKVLFLFTGSDTEEARELCMTPEEAWFLNEISGRLVIFENQKGQFLNVRQIAEHPGEAKKERIKKTFPWVSAVLAALNILVFLIVESRGDSMDGNYMFDCGAMWYPAVLEDHEYYRVFTSTFLHFGIEHLLNNMISLLLFGRMIEYHIGRVKFAVLYLGSGIFAGIASLLYHVKIERLAVSAGASGAIFGLIGAMLMLVIVNRGKLNGISLKQMLFLSALNLMVGFMTENVDIAAHVGGFFAGVLIVGIMRLLNIPLIRYEHTTDRQTYR